MNTVTEAAFDDLLTPDTLSALMRSTWTWDDRALRRDLAALLVELDAVRSAGSATDDPRVRTLQARARSSAARFVAAVLGPKLIADTGNPLRSQFVTDAVDPASFDRAAAESFALVRANSTEQIGAHARALAHAPESTWLELVASDGVAGLGTAMRAYGSSLCSSAFFGDIALSWQTLRAVLGDATEADDYAQKLLTGSMSGTLAAAEHTGSWDPAMVKTRATKSDDRWQLTGVKQFVPSAEGSDAYFVIARSTAGPSLFAVESAASGLTVTALDVVDATRPLSQVELSNAPAILLGSEGAGGRLMMRAIDLATTALCGEQVGLIDRAIDLLARHTADASDAPALETRLANITIDHVAASSLWQRALAEEAAGSPDASAAAAAAHVGCSAAAVRVATATAELLGPSADTDALLRRALSGSLLFGGPALSHERLLDRLGV